MARRRINNSKRRKEWRRNRAEELKRLMALVEDAADTYRLWHWNTYNLPSFNLVKGEQLRERLRQRTKRRYAAYEAVLNDR